MPSALALAAHCPQPLQQQRRRRLPRGRRATAKAALDACTLVAVASNVDRGLYDAGQAMNELVTQQLTELTPTSCVLVLLAGLATSVSPCTLSVLPLTIGYIGGYAADAADAQAGATAARGDAPAAGDDAASPSASTDAGAGSSSASASSSSRLFSQAVCFSLGLASSLAGLGVLSSSIGAAYGQIGRGLPTAVACVAILMGLNLLDVVRLPLPSVAVDVRAPGLPPPLMAYLAGATFALAASPCSTPVLASLLAFASTRDSPVAGGALLFLYSCGYVAPLLAAATATGAARRLLDMRRYSAWVPPVSGVLLVSGGTYALLSRLLPAF